jgi:hypothetical protein
MIGDQNPPSRTQLEPELTPKHSFLQMSGMTFGSIVEADRRLRIHGAWQRQHKKNLRDAEVWKRYEQEYELVSSRNQASQLQQQDQSTGDVVVNGKKE